MNQFITPRNVDGYPVVFNLRSGTALSLAATELCLRLATVPTGRLPAFMLSGLLQYRSQWLLSTSDGEKPAPAPATSGFRMPILLPSLDDLQDNQILDLIIPPYLIKERVNPRYPVLYADETAEMVREKVLIPEDDHGLQYIRLSTPWVKRIQRECRYDDMILAAWRMVSAFAHALPDPYTHPLQTVLASNSREALKTVILPFVGSQGISKLCKMGVSLYVKYNAL